MLITVKIACENALCLFPKASDAQIPQVGLHFFNDLTWNIKATTVLHEQKEKVKSIKTLQTSQQPGITWKNCLKDVKICARI